MILISIKLSSMFVDKPRTINFQVDENLVVGERPNLDAKLEKITIGQLYDIFAKGKQYFNDGTDPDDQLNPQLFEQWIYKTYIQEKGLMQRVIGIEYSKTKN